MEYTELYFKIKLITGAIFLGISIIVGIYLFIKRKDLE